MLLNFAGGKSCENVVPPAKRGFEALVFILYCYFLLIIFSEIVDYQLWILIFSTVEERVIKVQKWSEKTDDKEKFLFKKVQCRL